MIMTGEFLGGISIGQPKDLVASQRRAGKGSTSVTSSGVARGLALRSLVVSSSWDRLWNLLGRGQSVYFLSIAFDLSDKKVVVLPPKEVPEGAVFKVKHGEKITFSLGEGAPVFPARAITGGLIVYITICTADRGARHVGKVMAEVHEQLSKDDSLTKSIVKFVASPAQSVVEEVLAAATAALQPVATILKNNEDDYEALFTGIYPAKGPWTDRLTATQNGATIELAELR
jgi:hypothetical protein